jgi:hypothetical protein
MIEPKRIKSSSKIPALKRINEEGNEANGAENLKEADETYVWFYAVGKWTFTSPVSRRVANNIRAGYPKLRTIARWTMTRTGTLFIW